MLEDDAAVLFGLDPRFPFDDVEAIGARLMATGALTPGFVPPAAGLLTVQAMLYASRIERLPTVLLPDRNVVTRMARIARDGVVGREDPPTRLALDLMAFCQAMDIDIEPGLAFHELAQVMGDEVANEELRWFRVADTGERATYWIDLSVGRSDRLPALAPNAPENLPLSDAPHRWRCNYAAVLTATALELDGALSPVERFGRLLDWMADEFILAGPAAMFCTKFLSPRAPRAGLVKGFRSPDRDRALAGVRNAAWDVTYLSELTRRAQPGSYAKARCIFASADRALTELAPLLLIDVEEASDYLHALSERLEPWWGGDAGRIAGMLMDAIAGVEGRDAPVAPLGVDDYVGFKIAEGERRVATAV
ncbi:hypothetical protein [Sphingopyxis chilensis]